MDLSVYWAEFFSIAVLHFMAVASPGPDFAVVTRYSIRFGRQTGLWVSLGIGVGILVHIAYSLLGVALFIHRFDWVYVSVLAIGAVYLGWLGWQAIQARPRSDADLPTSLKNNDAQTPVSKEVSNTRAFGIGFLTNGLNVKATLFFLMLFSTIIAPATPTLVKLGYGVYMAIATAVWFSLLTLAMTWGPFYRQLWRYSHWVDRAMGLALLLISVHLISEVIARI